MYEVILNLTFLDTKIVVNFFIKDKTFDKRDIDKYIDNLKEELDKENDFSILYFKLKDLKNENLLKIKVKNIIEYYIKDNVSFNDKIKEKINKLMNLSFSPNKHEASVAMNKAMELMKKHSIAENDINTNNEYIIIHNVITEKIVPKWLTHLYSNLTEISGCAFCYSNGRDNCITDYRYGSCKIIGIKKDVLNCDYLLSIIENQINDITKKWLLTQPKKISNIKINSFQLGLINSVIERLSVKENSFFNKTSSNELITVDDKVKKSFKYLKKLMKIKLKTVSMKTKDEFYNKGIERGKDIMINKATTNESKIKLLT